MSQTKREFDATQLMQFKCGFDALSGEVLGMAVSGDPGDSIGGEQTITYIEVVETVDDFVKYLNVSASASIQVAFGHGGARAGWAETLSVHDYSVYVVVYISVTTGTKILQNPAFTHDAGQLLVQHPDDFRKQYGDEFLAGVTQGGEFIGFLEIRTKDQADQQQISAGLSGGGTFGAISGDASASLQQSISTLTSTQNLTLSTFQRGGSNAGLNQVTVNDLLQKATGFAATVTGADVFDYVAVFETYDILTPPTTPNPVDVQNQRDALEQLGLYKLRYMKVRDSIQYVLDNPGEFAAFDSSALTDKLNGINDFLNHLKDAASACFADLTKCKFPGFLVDPVVVLPQRLAVDVQTAVAAAQNSMTQANQAAVACKTHSDRIIQISQIIQVGPAQRPWQTRPRSRPPMQPLPLRKRRMPPLPPSLPAQRIRKRPVMWLRRQHQRRQLPQPLTRLNRSSRRSIEKAIRLIGMCPTQSCSNGRTVPVISGRPWRPTTTRPQLHLLAYICRIWRLIPPVASSNSDWSAMS